MKLMLFFVLALMAAAVELIVIEVRSQRAHQFIENESRGEVFVLLFIASFAALLLVAW